MPDRVKKQRFAALALLMIVVFSYPLLSVANKLKTIMGLPVLYAYIFLAWIIFIVLLYRSAEKKGPKNNPGS
jgi:Ca2+/Na+ antiporter